MRGIRHRRCHRRDASIVGEDWDGAIILPEISCGGGGGGGGSGGGGGGGGSGGGGGGGT